MTLLRSLLCAAAGTTLVSAVAFAQALGAAPSPMSPDTVLADNGVAKVTRADYDYELTRLPENVRGGFATTDKRVADLINRMLVTKTLAAQADAQKLMEQPEVARRLALEIEKLKAQLMVAKLEADARPQPRRRPGNAGGLLRQRHHRRGHHPVFGIAERSGHHPAQHFAAV